MLLPFAPPPAQASPADQLAETRRELRAARTQLATLVRSDQELKSIIGTMARRLNQTRTSLRGAQEELAAIEARIHTEERRIVELESEREGRREALERRARTLYILGPGFEVQSILQAADVSELIGRSAALEQVMRYDRGVIEELSIIELRTARARDQLLEERAAAVGVRDAIAAQEALEAEMLATRRSAQNQLHEQISDFRDHVRDLEREQARIERLIRQRQSVSIGPVSRHGFAWPIRGRINSPYGWRGREFHTGIDIGCRTGDPLGASKAGTVIASEWGGGYGNMIIIDHGNGVSTLYAHLSSLGVSRGQQVSQHHRIGACGMTGRASGPHLHFEVRVNGRHQNPMHFLP